MPFDRDGKDEYDIDFDDNREFAALRWDQISRRCHGSFSAADLDIMSEFGSVRGLGKYVREAIKSTNPPPAQLLQVWPAINALKVFSLHFFNFIAPEEQVDTSMLWGPLYLMISLSLESDSELKLTRITEILVKIRRYLELFIYCIKSYEEEKEINDIRLAMVDVLAALVLFFVDTAKYLRTHPNDDDANKAWPTIEKKSTAAISEIDETVKHLHNIAAFTKLTADRQSSYIQRKNAVASGEDDESGVFPCENLPFSQNENFYGREDVLKKMERYLDWHGSQSLRTFTIYGRRGVGKTQIALEFAHRNPSKFDAIFWIQCETSAALRQSFTDMAIKLDLRGAIKSGHHEENLLLVHEWLKKTDRHWLLIFDNAENDKLMEIYWPACKGAVLITSREYYNFNNDASRSGQTVSVFNEEESWEILTILLDWRDKLDEIKQEELQAAKVLLQRIGGLALAIEQLASLIRAQRSDMQKFLRIFEESSNRLPPRLGSSRSTLVHSLDTLWSISFDALSTNAKTLLGVMCLLSPDTTPLDTFLPKNQNALSQSLQFCRRDAGQTSSRTALSMVNPSPGFTAAMQELLSAKLIRKEGRILSVHRVVQEAFAYLSAEELQDAFDSAVRLVYEAFPKQINGRPLYPEWQRCQAYIQDGLFLAHQFGSEKLRNVDPPVRASPEFVELLANCAWQLTLTRYLYEIGDHLENLQILEIAYSACEDKESLLYAHLRNTAGVSYFELNNLTQAQKCLEISLAIRESKLNPGDEEVANTINNLGLVESAKGELKTAMQLFDRAEDIRAELGDESASLLAITYMSKGRCLYLMKDIEQAITYFESAEALLMRTVGANSQLMAYLHYAYGNLERLQKNRLQAKRAYEAALKILLVDTPAHVLTSSTLYKLACVEESQGNIEKAKANLEKALRLGELRRSGLNDGNIARILWKKGVLLSENVFASPNERQLGEDLKGKATFMRRDILMENGLSHELVEATAIDAVMEASYDNLVCGFFR